MNFFPALELKIFQRVNEKKSYAFNAFATTVHSQISFFSVRRLFCEIGPRVKGITCEFVVSQ